MYTPRYIQVLSTVYLLLLTFISVVYGTVSRPPRLRPRYCRTEEDFWSGIGNCRTKVHIYFIDELKQLLKYKYVNFDLCSDSEYPYDCIHDGVTPFLIPVYYNENVTDQELWIKSYDRYDDPRLTFLKNRIHDGYVHKWLIDDIPVMWCSDRKLAVCTPKFPVGCYVTHSGRQLGFCSLYSYLNERDTTYIFNHINITIAYESLFNGDGLVGAQVQLTSCNHLPCHNSTKGMKIPTVPLKAGENFTITYSYSVEFVEVKNIRWKDSWNFRTNPPQPFADNVIIDLLQPIDDDYILHHMQVLIGIGITIFILPGWILMQSYLMQRGITGSVFRPTKDIPKELKWRQLYDDVFRPPTGTMMLSVFGGTGVHLCIVTLFSLFITYFTDLSFTWFITTELLFFPFLGIVSGYVSAWLYKFMGGLDRNLNGFTTSFFYPGIVLVVISITDYSALLPILFCFWCGILVPSTFLGTFLGFYSAEINQPVYELQNFQQGIPKLGWHLHVLAMLVSGIYPSLYFLLPVYHFVQLDDLSQKFDLILITFLFAVVGCSELAILCSLLFLQKGDYRWWWQSYFCGGSLSMYLFAFMMFYYYKVGIQEITSFVMFFGYAFIIVLSFFLITGSLGFIACLCYMKKMFANPCIVN